MLSEVGCCRKRGPNTLMLLATTLYDQVDERQKHQRELEELEALRKSELEAHVHRSGELAGRLGAFEDKMLRMRLDVSEWAAQHVH